MKWSWAELFGSEYYIEIKNSERKYFGLAEIAPEWEKSEFFSKTNFCYKRTVVFWDKTTVRKVITEENRMTDDNVIHSRHYQEHDTEILTEQREMILPLTARGKKKKVTATNILSITPFGCQFWFSLNSISKEPYAGMGACNLRNNQHLAIGEEERIRAISTPADFRSFIEDYIKTCPDDYFDRVHRMQTEKHKTVKYRPGDIFRAEVDRFHYCYGLITGEIKKIQQWAQLPQRHSLRSLMMVPLMIRFYDRLTTDRELKAEDLKDIPLGRVRICGDNDIIWGTHPIVDRKRLTADDVEFNLVCTKFLTENKHCTVFSQDMMLVNEKLSEKPREYSVYVEWGTASTVLPYSQLSDKLKEYLNDYRSPHGGVSIGIRPSAVMFSESRNEQHYEYRYNLQEKHNQYIKDELFACLNLPSDAGFDDFAEKFGGMSRSDIAERIAGENR